MPNFKRVKHRPHGLRESGADASSELSAPLQTIPHSLSIERFTSALLTSPYWKEAFCKFLETYLQALHVIQLQFNQAIDSLLLEEPKQIENLAVQFADQFPEETCPYAFKIRETSLALTPK